MSEKPVRAHELELTVSAHTLEDMAAELRNFADRIEREGLSSSGVCGGVPVSHTYSYRHSPEMTPERWQQSLKDYLADRRAHRD